MDEDGAPAARIAAALLALILAIALLAALPAGGADACAPAILLALLALVLLGPAPARPSAAADRGRRSGPAARAPPALPTPQAL